MIKINDYMLCVRIPQFLHDKIEDLAGKSEVSKAVVVRAALEFSLERWGKDKKIRVIIE